MPVVKSASSEGIARIQNWVQVQRIFKARNPKHRVIVDVGMECMYGLPPADLVRRIRGDETLGSWQLMREVNLGRIWEVIQAQQSRPTGGAGGLGIIGETIAWSAARFGEEENLGLFNISLLHTTRRVQSFKGNRQEIQTVEVSAEGQPDYLPLGEITTVSLYGKEIPLQAWLFTGFSKGDNFVPAIRLSVPGVTGIIYPHCESQQNLDQMQVLGQGGFRVAQYFGLVGVEDPIADLVIGHDGHTALFKFNLFLWFLNKYGDKEKALQATRRLCVATIHAPQNGTVPRTTGEMFGKHYSPTEERLWGELGLDPGKKTNALFADVELSIPEVGVISPLHRMVTQAEEKARQRAFTSDTANLLPDNLDTETLNIYPDTLDVESWLGMGVMEVLDQYYSGWRADPSSLGNSRVIDDLRFNADFREDLSEAFAIQEHHLLELLGNYFPRKFGVAIPGDAIIFASLRRATVYKIGLLTAFLRHHQIIENIAISLNRPIFYLFGGLAHQDDSLAIDSLEQLLNVIDLINRKGGRFQADFLINYDLDKARWIFPGLSRRGCWVGATNPLDRRSQGTEAFGPSYLKAAMNGIYIMGPDDGGAACLRHLPTVHIYGPTTFAGETSFHNDLWNNKAIVEASRFLLANGFIKTLEQVARRIAEDLERFENGRGAQAPGLGIKIESMFKTIADYNGRVLLRSYLTED